MPVAQSVWKWVLVNFKCFVDGDIIIPTKTKCTILLWHRHERDRSIIIGSFSISPQVLQTYQVIARLDSGLQMVLVLVGKTVVMSLKLPSPSVESLGWFQVPVERIPRAFLAVIPNQGSVQLLQFPKLSSPIKCNLATLNRGDYGCGLPQHKESGFLFSCCT